MEEARSSGARDFNEEVREMEGGVRLMLKLCMSQITTLMVFIVFIQRMRKEAQNMLLIQNSRGEK